MTMPYLPTAGAAPEPMHNAVYTAQVANATDPLAQGRVRLLIPQLLGTAWSNWATAMQPGIIPSVGTPCLALFLGGNINAPYYFIGVTQDVIAAITGNTTVLNTNPYFTGQLTTGWTATNGTLTAVTPNADTNPPLPSAVLYTAAGSGGGYIQETGMPFPAVVGQPYQLQVWVYYPLGGSVSFGFGWNGSPNTLTTATVPAGAWSLVSVVETAPTTSGWPMIGPVSTVPGSQLTATAITVTGQIPGQIISAGSITNSQVNFVARDIGGITSTIAATAPTGAKAGDLWLNSASGYQLSQYDGVSWNLYQFGTGAIQAASITAALIVANTITAAQIATGTITATQIAAGTITAAQIAAGSITTNEISITAGITGGQIAGTTITGGNISTSTVTGSNIASTTITGGNIASTTITGGNIASTTITGGNIVTGTITATQIAANTITAAKIAANTITAAQITAGTITTTEIATNTITASDISLTAGITGGQIAGTTITGTNIATGTVTATQIAGGTITASKLTSGIVVSGIVDATTITGAHLVCDGSSGGELLIYSGTPAAGNLVASIDDSGGTDAHGNIYLSGVAAYNNSNGNANQLGAASVNFYTGSLSGGWTVETWHTGSSFTNGWTGTLRYMYVAVAGGIVMIDVKMVPGTVADGTTFFTLGSLYQPATFKRIAMGCDGLKTSGSSFESASLYIGAAGQLECYGVNLSATYFEGSGTYSLVF